MAVPQSTCKARERWAGNGGEQLVRARKCQTSALGERRRQAESEVRVQVGGTVEFLTIIEDYGIGEAPPERKEKSTDGEGEAEEE